MSCFLIVLPTSAGHLGLVCHCIGVSLVYDGLRSWILFVRLPAHCSLHWDQRFSCLDEFTQSCRYTQLTPLSPRLFSLVSLIYSLFVTLKPSPALVCFPACLPTLPAGPPLSLARRSCVLLEAVHYLCYFAAVTGTIASVTIGPHRPLPSASRPPRSLYLCMVIQLACLPCRFYLSFIYFKLFTLTLCFCVFSELFRLSMWQRISVCVCVYPEPALRFRHVVVAAGPFFLNHWAQRPCFPMTEFILMNMLIIFQIWAVGSPRFHLLFLLQHHFSPTLRLCIAMLTQHLCWPLLLGCVL